MNLIRIDVFKQLYEIIYNRCLLLGLWCVSFRSERLVNGFTSDNLIGLLALEGLLADLQVLL
jgi:hypothetical protein